MPVRYVNIDYDSPMPMPLDLRDWVKPDHMVHFIINAVNSLDMSLARTNQRGTGHAQYPPAMMLSLLIYSYAIGVFSSRSIETLTYENVAVRFLTCNHHPDHDSICKFRRENKDFFTSAFHQVLELAARSKMLKVSDITVAIDGTKILANASKHSAVSYDHAVKHIKIAEDEIAQLMQKAEDANSIPLQSGLTIPEEIKRREDRIAELTEAKKVIEERAKERFIEEQATYQEKLEARAAKQQSSGKKPRGKAPQPPKEGPRGKDQYNFTDPESRIMKVRGGFEQSYNAQAAVEVDSMLIVGEHVTEQANDKEQLIPTFSAVSPVIKKVSNVLVDSGYYSGNAVETLESEAQPVVVYAAVNRQSHGRSVEQLEVSVDPPSPPQGASVGKRMAHRLDTAAGKKLYGLRKQTVEPVFGIIKQAMRFRGFLLRGKEKVSLEWTLVTTSYNLKRLFNFSMSLKKA